MFRTSIKRITCNKLLSIGETKSNTRLIPCCFLIRVSLDVNGVAKALSASHYYAYGMEISDLVQESGESTPYPRLRTTGKEAEEMESLYWLDFGPRRYDAPLCRWSGTDPLAEEDYGTSPYAYCNGLPTALVDPSGLQAQCYRDAMDLYRRSGGYTGPVYDWS